MNISLIKYLLSLFLFGSNGVVASYIALNSYEIVFLRTFIGCATLILLFQLTRKKASFRQYPKETFFILLSGAAMGAGWIFLFEAYRLVGVGVSSLLYYCGPVIVMALSPILFREKLTPVKVLGFVAVLIGLVLVNGNVQADGSSYFGIFCGVMSAVMLALLIILNKFAKNILGLENSMIQLCGSFLVVAVYLLFRQGFHMAIAADDVFPILLLGVVNTGLGCYLYFSSIGRLPVQTVAVCGYLEPMSAVIFSVVILHETMLPLQILGAALIIGGAFFSEYRKTNK